MTASEMMSFIHFLPFMIGELISEKDELWEIIIILIQIIDMVTLTKISVDHLTLLDELVSQHNKLYVKLSKQSLKPKQHFLVHCSTCIKKCGPLKLFWCMRFEAKHKDFKEYARVISSRVNMAKTLAIKAGLKFANSLLNGDFLENEAIISNVELIKIVDQSYYANLIYDHNDFNFSSY